MKPIKFNQQNVVFAKNQAPYLELPAYRGTDGRVITCWSLSWLDRIKVALTGCVWVNQLTLNKPLQPLRLDVDLPFKPEGA